MQLVFNCLLFPEKKQQHMCPEIFTLFYNIELYKHFLQEEVKQAKVMFTNPQPPPLLQKNTRRSTHACVHTYTLTGGTSPSICSSSSSDVGTRAAVLRSMLRPPALRAILSLLLSTSESPWLHSESPGVRLNDDSVDTRTRRLRFNLWRLCEASRLGWEGCRKRGLMKHGDRGLDVQVTDMVGGPLGGPGEA